MTSTLMNIEADKCQEVLRWLFISQGRVMKQLSQALASKDEMFSEGTINYERQTRRLIHWTTHNIISLINLPHGNPRYAESDKSFGQMESGEPGHIGPLPPCRSNTNFKLKSFLNGSEFTRRIDFPCMPPQQRA